MIWAGTESALALLHSSNLVGCPTVITVELVVPAVEFAVPLCRFFSKTLLPSFSHINITVQAKHTQPAKSQAQDSTTQCTSSPKRTHSIVREHIL